jgi:hypothetical protein
MVRITFVSRLHHRVATTFHVSIAELERIIEERVKF